MLLCDPFQQIHSDVSPSGQLIKQKIVLQIVIIMMIVGTRIPNDGSMSTPHFTAPHRAGLGGGGWHKYIYEIVELHLFMLPDILCGMQHTELSPPKSVSL